MSQSIPYNTTSPTVTVYVMDAAGQPATGATLTAKYRRDKGALADATSVTEVDATEMAGVYDVVLPDAAALVGASEIEVTVKGADVVQAAGRETVTLGPLVATEEAAMLLERPQGDTQAISFTWPVSGATITATRSIDGGASAAVTGAITQATDLGDEHWYELAFNAADRPATTGEVVYTLTDGTNTRYLRLRVLVGGATSSGSDSTALSGAVNDGNPNTLSFVANITGLGSEASVVHRALVFTSGNLQADVRRITAYDRTTGRITVGDALLAAPANGDTFLIVGYVR
ncbi:MAG: hypothetical protein AAF593_00200 [Planctomycetota bacterium]